MVPAEYVDTCWAKIEPFAEKAAEYTYGRYTANNIYELINAYTTNKIILELKSLPQTNTRGMNIYVNDRIAELRKTL